MPFQVRDGIKLAPLVRMQIGTDQKSSLEEHLKTQNPLVLLYLRETETGLHKPVRFEKICSAEDKDDDVMVAGQLMTLI